MTQEENEKVLMLLFGTHFHVHFYGTRAMDWEKVIVTRSLFDFEGKQ